MSRPRLLFVCQNLPYPPDGGARIRSYHTLRLLSEVYDVTALHFYDLTTNDGVEGVERAVTELSRLARVQAFRIPQDADRLRYVWDHARSVVSGRAYTRWMFESREARAALRHLHASTSFDIVHLDSLDLVAFLDDLPRAPIVVAHHNVESQLLRRRADAESGWRRNYMAHQAALTEREERSWCPRVDLNLVVSSEDLETFRRIAPDGRYLVVPNGVDTRTLVPSPDEEKRGLAFVGGYSWFPNRDGMEYFTEEILPLVLRERPGTPVTWIGRAPDDARHRFSRLGVHMTGYVDEISSHVQAAACVIVPLRVGGGTRLKILDAWALGAAVVSTSPGCEGLEIADGRNILVADTPDAFAEAILSVLSDDELRQRLEREGRETAVRRYDWDVIGEEMRREYAKLVGAGLPG